MFCCSIPFIATLVMVRLTISMHFSSLKTSNFYFLPGEHAPGTPQNPCRVSNRPELGRIVTILLENPES